MKKIKNTNILFLFGLCALLAGVLSSCGTDEVEEPSVYAPKQLKRLLLSDLTKTWQQSTEYYLDDSCRVGYRLRFEDNAQKKINSAFFAYFVPDSAICDASREQQPFHKVKIITSPVYKTTDSLLFITQQQDTIIKTIRLLTNQRLQLNVAGKNGGIERVEEYEVVD